MGRFLNVILGLEKAFLKQDTKARNNLKNKMDKFECKKLNTSVQNKHSK